MGAQYNSGDQVFAPVMEELLLVKDRIGEEVLQKVASKLIRGLLNLGWDNADGWPGIYDSEPAIIAAFNEYGIQVDCMSENAEYGWSCEEERGHYPASDHKDFLGRTWGHDEEVQ